VCQNVVLVLLDSIKQKGAQVSAPLSKTIAIAVHESSAVVKVLSP
jgi:hypothetical protein